MTKSELSELKELAKDVMVRRHDTYCGFGYMLMSQGLLEKLKTIPNGPDVAYETMTAIIEGFMVGLAEAERQSRDNPNYMKSPMKELEEALQPKEIEPVKRYYFEPKDKS